MAAAPDLRHLGARLTRLELGVSGLCGQRDLAAWGAGLAGLGALRSLSINLEHLPHACTVRDLGSFIRSGKPSARLQGVPLL